MKRQNTLNSQVQQFLESSDKFLELKVWPREIHRLKTDFHGKISIVYVTPVDNRYVLCRIKKI